MTQTTPAVIRVAHSPDADDAFMFYALAENKVDTEGLQFEHILQDIQSLNEEAHKGTYELTALSYYAYAQLRDKYAILSVGSSIGDKYGPVVVAKTAMTKEELLEKDITVAVPGELTSAFLALKIWCPQLKTEVVPFDQIQEKVKSGEYQAGVIIHEGQLTYADEGLQKVVDLGEWWYEMTNLVLPLGCNGIRKDLGEELIAKIARVLYRSVKWGLDNREEALAGCQKYAGDLPPEKTDTFVGMYVNAMTLDADVEIRKAVKLMLWMGYDLGLVEEKFEPEFIEMSPLAEV